MQVWISRCILGGIVKSKDGVGVEAKGEGNGEGKGKEETYSGNLNSIALLPGLPWNKCRSCAACSIIAVCSVFRRVHSSRQ